MRTSPDTAAQKLNMMRGRAHTCDEDKKQEVGTDKDVSIVRWVNGPKTQNKVLSDSNKLKCIDKQQCNLLPKE